MDARVFLARADTYETDEIRAAIHRCFEAFGGAKALCGGKKVVVKPNLLLAFPPEAAATTHPAVVQAVCEELIAADCKVVVAESAGGAAVLQRQKKLYNVTGMEQAASASGAELPLTFDVRTVKYPAGQVCRSFQLLSEIADAEFLVDVGKMKTHGFAYYTGAVKNLFGSVPGLTKPAMHSLYPDREHFAGMIADLCELVHPGFCILDGVYGMEGHGPSGGSPKRANVIVAGVNPYAVDLAAMHVMGLDPDKAPIHREGVRRGEAPEKLEELTLSGDPLDSFRTHFVPADGSKKARHPFLPKPIRRILDERFKVFPAIIRKKCVGCGECAKTCPRRTIHIENKKAVVDYDGCIRCYCCHELCPKKAIRFVRRAVPVSKARKTPENTARPNN